MNRKQIVIFAFSFSFLLFAFLWAQLAHADGRITLGGNTWYVNAGTGDDNNDCLTPSTACATIGGAVDKAFDDDTIEIAAGTYNEHDIEVFKQLTLIGAGMTNTVVDAGGNGRVFRVGSIVQISNLRMQNGQTSDGDIFAEGGGAVLVSGDLILKDVAMVGNHAIGNGGAIFNVGTLELENTLVVSNTADAIGGGIYNYNIGVITMTQSTVANNTAVGIFGGGIFAGGTSITVHDSTIANNSAASFGGGMTLNINGTAILDGVTVADNQAASGAGLFSQQGIITATNITVSGNNATNNYGGIYVSGPNTSIYLQNSTIAYNTRTNTAGNGFNGVMTGNNATASLVNSIVAHNQENNCASSQPPTSLGHNLSNDFSCAFTQSGDLQGFDPLLGALADNGGYIPTHGLMPGSPAIDNGDDAQCPATDAREVTRPYDGDGDSVPVCDIGAVEARHQISIDDTSVLEGDGSSVTAVFTVTLAPTSTNTVEVDYATMDDTAVAGQDYIAEADTLTFSPGETEKYISVSVNGDFDDEFDETFKVLLSDPVNADLLDAEAVGTIVDNDGLPALTIVDQSLLEGNAGVTDMQFEVTLSPASASVVTVDYMTMNGTATAGSDYTMVGDTLTFQPGQTNKTLAVSILGDITDEGSSEEFTVLLSSPSNAALADGEAAGTITDDDNARLSHEFGPHVPEGDSGFVPAVFSVTLSTPAAFPINVDFEVSSGFGDDGAKAGEDFVPISGTVTFQPGETEQTYTVQMIGDTIIENDESYSSLIGNANVPITVNGSLAAILNDDGDDDDDGGDDNYWIYLPIVIK